MTTHRGWMSYPLTYCAREMEILAAWIREGQSGAVVGPPGVGKSNLLGFLVIARMPWLSILDTTSHPVALVFIDLNDLPVFDVATLYRVILRAFYECRQQFPPLLLQTVTTTYQETRTLNDPFTVQNGPYVNCFFCFRSNRCRLSWYGIVLTIFVRRPRRP